MKLSQRGCAWLIVTSLIVAHHSGQAEGTRELSPTNTDLVLLHTNASGFGDFASYDGDSTSRLNVYIDDFTSETVYLGLSAEADNDGVINSSYWFRIKDPTGAVVHGPFQVTMGNQNTPTWDLAVAGPDVLNPGSGYATTELYSTFTPAMNGDHYIEFSESATMDANNLVNVKWYDVTVVSGGAELPGRLWSLRWALRTPEDVGAPPECEWDRPFNGSFYTYTMDGFVSLIDFDGSGFQGLSFTVAFGMSGPGTTGDVIQDRKSVNAGDSTAAAADHMVFLNEPDANIFPSSQDLCGDVSFLGVSCVGDDLCILVGVTQMGQVEVLLDFFGDNGVYDPNTQDVLIAQMFDEPDTACILWDKLKGDGSMLEFDEPVPAIIRYSQGVQHYAAFDVEFLKNGFCVETIRPICSGQSNLLYWDDSNIVDNISTPFNDESDPGTGQPLVQLNGCICGVGNCRTWTNFQTGINPDDCDGAPTGYGDFRTLNTWWFASSITIGPFDLPVVRAQVSNDTLVCSGGSVEFTVEGNPDSLAYMYSWEGPGGFMSDMQSTGPVSEPGVYSVTITDPETGCSASDSAVLGVAAGIMTSLSAMCVANNSPNSNIDLMVSGGTPPFMYEWSNGEMTEDIMNVPPGQYFVTVTDDFGCTTVDSITVDVCCELDITCPPTNGGTFECVTDLPMPDTTLITVNDFCISITITSMDTDNGGSGCMNDTLIITRTYTVEDGIGNTGTCVQVFRVADNVTFTAPPDVTIECDEDTSPSNTGDVLDFDACPGSSLDFMDDVTPGMCEGEATITRTWVAIDPCGNMFEQEQTITVVDTEAPMIVPGTCPADTTIACGSGPGDFGVPMFSDNCSTPNLMIDIDSIGFDGPGSEGEIHRTFIITDDCGNVNSSCVQIIFVVDTVAPMVICPPDVTVECGESTDPAQTGMAEFVDNCGDPQEVVLTMSDDSVGFDGMCVSGVIMRTFTAEDADGNIGMCVQAISVIDTTPPTFDVPADVTVECDADFDDLNLLGNISNVDDCSAIGSTSYNDVFGMMGCDGTGEIIRTWSVTDACGEVATGIQLIVVQDNVPPDLQPPPDVTIDCTQDPQDTSVTGGIVVITDACSMEFLLEYEDDLSGLTGCGGTGVIVRTWNASDECDNLAMMQQLITVVDNTPPVPLCNDITLDFDIEEVQTISPDIVDGGSFDACGDVTLSLPQSTFDCIEFVDNPVQPYNLVVTDECGNSASCVFNITGMGGGGIILTCPSSDIYVHLKSGQCEARVSYFVEAVRRCGTEDPVLVQVDNSGLTSGDFFEIGVYPQEYVAYNSMGDTVSCSFNIHVIENPQTNNTLTCNDLINVSLDQNCEAFINPDDILEGGSYGCFDDFIVEIVGVGSDFGGVLINLDNVTLGNMYTVIITDTKTGFTCWGKMLVEDKIPPVVECMDHTIFCTTPTAPVFAIPDTQPLPYAPVAEDQCGTVFHQYSDEIFESACGIDSIQRTWVFSDLYGNTTECLQTLHIALADVNLVEPPPPFFGDCFSSLDPNVTGWPTFMGTEITSTASCDILSLYEDVELEDCGNGRKFVRKWTVVNGCLQMITHFDQVIKLQDTEAPELSCPEDVTINTQPWYCVQDLSLPRPDVTDACGSDYVLSVDAGDLQDNVTGSSPFFVLNDIPLGTWPVTWIAVDDCGNQSECTFYITVVDEVPPVPLCDAHTVVSLTNDPGIENGLTKIHAEVFDDGSYDNCGPISFRARRITSCIDFDWTTNGAGEDEIPNGIVDARDRGMTFRDYVPFACCDVGAGPIMVELNVTDAFGNFNSCMVEVTVDDKLPPLIECPPDVVLSCDFWFDAQETNGFVEPSEDVLTPIFGEVLDAFDYQESDRQAIVISDPGRPSNPNDPNYLPQPFAWGIDGWADDNCDVEITVRVRIFEDCSGNDFPVNPPSPHTVKLVERTWRAVDGQGNSATCIQRIWVVDFNPFYISDETCVNADPNDGVIWPCDKEYTTCPAEIPVDYPQVFDDNCSLVGVTYEDDRFNVAEDACYKILRTWTVIDWCQYEVNTGSGIWTHTQVIKILDNQGAQFDGCPDEPLAFCVDDPNVQLPDNNQVFLGEGDPNASHCSVHLQLEHTITETCSDYVLYDVKVYPFDGPSYLQVVNTTEVQLDSNQMATLTFDTRTSAILAVRQNGLPYNDAYCNDAEKDYHRILWSVEDGCGNISTCSYLFRLEDCKAPSPVCVGLSSVVMPSSGEVTIWAVDFNASSFDDCTPAQDLLFSFSGTDYEPSRMYNCDSLVENGTSKLVEIWVADEGTDDNCDGLISWDERNKDYCTTFIVLDDNEQFCGDLGNVGGTVLTEDEQSVELVHVQLFNATGELVQEHTTAGDGRYVFVNPLFDYTIEAMRNDDPKNGVSTLDLVRVQQHTLGMLPLETPYKLIAADANNSQSISALDLIEIRKLILGTSLEYEVNSSWRFIPKDFIFVDPSNPWPFEEVLDFSGGVSMEEDFIGVKIGDVNETVVANAQAAAEVKKPTNALKLILEDRKVIKGQTVEIAFTSDVFDRLLGYQMTLEHPGLELTEVRQGALDMTMKNIGLHDGKTAVSWHHTEVVSQPSSEVLFTLVFDVLANGILSEMMWVSSDIAAPEAYKGDDIAFVELLSVELQFENALSPDLMEDYTLYQNEPNPFEDVTTIGFTVPDPTFVTVTIRDVTGRVIHSFSGDYPKGYSTVEIMSSDLGASGVLYYHIDAGAFSATKKMIKID